MRLLRQIESIAIEQCKISIAQLGKRSLKHRKNGQSSRFIKRIFVKRKMAYVSEIYCYFDLRGEVIARVQIANYLDKRLRRMTNETRHGLTTNFPVYMAVAYALR